MLPLVADSEENTTRAARLEDIHLRLVRGAVLVVADGPDAGRRVEVTAGTVLVGSAGAWKA